MTPLRVRGFLNRTKVRCVHSNERKCAKSQEGRSIAARYPKSMTRMNSPARYKKLRVSVNVYKERVGPLVVSCCCSLWLFIYLLQLKRPRSWQSHTSRGIRCCEIARYELLRINRLSFASSESSARARAGILRRVQQREIISQVSRIRQEAATRISP